MFATDFNDDNRNLCGECYRETPNKGLCDNCLLERDLDREEDGPELEDEDL